MRNAFKKQAELNASDLQKMLGEWIDGAWQLASKVSQQIDNRLILSSIDKRSLDIIILIRNCVSDILCCLDSLERGHNKTIDNNLRMIFEHCCLSIWIFHKDDVYADFINDNISAQKAVNFAKPYLGGGHMGYIYNIYSKVTHHQLYSLLARQIVSIRDGKELYMHLKPIDVDKTYTYLNHLSLIIILLRFLGEHAERVCAPIIQDFYFLQKIGKDYQSNLNISEQLFIDRLFSHMKSILESKKIV